jgi:hypothetical protein
MARRIASALDLRHPPSTPALRVPVLRMDGTRHATLLTFSDHVALHALADLARPAVERTFGPRESRRDTDRWASFDHDAVRSDPRYVAIADIASFYGSVDYGRVEEVLWSCGAPQAVTDVLPSMLRGVMGAAGGLPWDSAASDLLASAVMAPVDRAMESGRWTYLRMCDDFRIGTADRSSAEASLARLDAEISGLGMRLNQSKTEILSVSDYRARLLEPRAALRRELLRGLVVRLARMRPDRAVRVAVRDRMAALDLDACVRTIAHELDRRADARIRWPNDIGNVRLEWSFRALTAARSPRGLGLAGEAFGRFPFLVPTVSRYLAAVVTGREGRAAVEVVHETLDCSALRPAVERAWLYFALCRSPASSSVVERAATAARNSALDQLERVEAARFAARAGGLDHDTLDGLRSSASPHFDLELEEISGSMGGGAWHRGSGLSVPWRW